MSEKTPEYNVFISWSGEASKRVAHAVQDWLSNTIQAASPFLSDKNIDAGDRGLEEIGNQLDRIRTGIICLTNQNQGSSWINYEAGALSKRVPDKSYVICLLFDLEPGQVRYPLATFQNGPISEEYMARVAHTVNKSLGSPLNEARLEAAFKLSWPALATGTEKIRAWNAQQAMEEVEPVRTPEDMFEEIVVAIREQSAVLAELKKPNPRTGFASTQLHLTGEVLKKLADMWEWGTPLSAKDVADIADHLTPDDWRVIRTAPFLAWYLEHYFNVYQQKPKPQLGAPVENDDDIPF